MPDIAEKRSFWKKCADAVEIPFHYTKILPHRAVDIVENPASWQGLEAVSAGTTEETLQKSFAAGESVILDFGTYVTGKLHLNIETTEGRIHAPVRLRLFFAEQLCEFAGSNGKGLLSASWLQEEIINIDRTGCHIELPRRYSFNYLRMEVLCASSPVYFRDLYAVSSTSAIPCSFLQYEKGGIKQKIDTCCIRTLENCMQMVFEDGPRRDRRLWLGDLRLQALVNSVTYRNAALVERSLYLLASETADNGMIPACIFDGATVPSDTYIVDYSLLLGDILYFHAASYGMREIVRELYPLALRQLELFRKHIGGDGLFRDPGGLWLFIDWSEKLERELPVTGVYVYALRQCAGLAEMLDDGATAVTLAAEAEEITLKLRNYICDDGLIRTGMTGQLSYAAQIWMILAGIFTPDRGRQALAALEKHPESLKPFTPYLWHHYVEACFAAGDAERAEKFIYDYWGGMIKRGARTFWEVYYPQDDKFSPYLDPALNSSCHAWSCTPAYFFRKFDIPL